MNVWASNIILGASIHNTWVDEETIMFDINGLYIYKFIHE